MQDTDVSLLLTVEESAEILRISVNDLFELMSYGTIPYILICEKKLIRRSDLVYFIEHCTPVNR